MAPIGSISFFAAIFWLRKLRVEINLFIFLNEDSILLKSCLLSLCVQELLAGTVYPAKLIKKDVGISIGKCHKELSAVKI